MKISSRLLEKDKNYVLSCVVVIGRRQLLSRLILILNNTEAPTLSEGCAFPFVIQDP